MIRESMIRAGIDYDNGVRRFLGKAQLYEKYLMKFFEKNSLMELQSQLETGDYGAAFRTAHGIKGVCGNLNMGNLYDAICKLVEYLRAGGQGDKALVLFRQILGLYHTALSAAKE